jgi:hypothetical protein
MQVASGAEHSYLSYEAATVWIVLHIPLALFSLGTFISRNTP